MILMDGKVVSTSEQAKPITIAEYEALSEEERNNGTAYYISDYDDNEYKKLIKVGNVIGREERLSGYADGTIIGAIVDIYNRLGGLSLSLDKDDVIVFSYDGTAPTPAVTPGASENMTDLEKINHFQEVIGDVAALNNIGFSNVIAAIRSIYDRLGGVEFDYNDATSSFSMIYSEDNTK